jgi:hypothetical protein
MGKRVGDVFRDEQQRVVFGLVAQLPQLVEGFEVLLEARVVYCRERVATGVGVMALALGDPVATSRMCADSAFRIAS